MRANNKLSVSRLQIPFDAIFEDKENMESFLRSHIDDTNQYKSFVAPDKIAETIGCFIPHPWKHISSSLGTAEDLAKRRLRNIVDWRNRIAHQADINPNLGGIEMWPIIRSDVINALDDLARYADAIVSVLEKHSG